MKGQRFIVKQAKWVGLLVVLSCLFVCTSLSLAVPDDVSFPVPVRSGGMPFFSALQRRQSVTSFDSRLLHWETVGNLLWAAVGLTRFDSGVRTVPGIVGAADIRIYVLAAEGVWLYDVQSHRLTGLDDRDLRSLALSQDAGGAGTGRLATESVYVVGDTVEKKTPPIVVLFVAPSMMSLDGGSGGVGTFGISHSDGLIQQALQVGHISQNIQLFAASEGLGVQTESNPDREELAKAMKVSTPVRILLALGVGYPASRM